MRLAAGDDADRRLRRGDDLAVERIDLGEGAHRVELGVQPLLDLQRRQVGPAVVQPVGGANEAGLRLHLGRALPCGDPRVGQVEVDRRAALDHLGQGSEADPVAREARQGPAVEAELQVLGDARRRHHRHVPGLHRHVALMRHRGGDAAVVVAGDHQHAAVRRRAVGVAVLERVAGAVDARALAVPHGEHAVGGSLRVGLDPLRAEHRGRTELLVDRGQELHAGRIEQLLRLPGLLVDHAERRAAIAADEALRLHSGRRVAGRLHQRQADQRLSAGEEDHAVARREVVGEAVFGTGKGLGHGASGERG